MDNVIGYFHVAGKFQLSDLESSSIKFLSQNLADVVQKAEFRDLSPEQINTFLTSYHVSSLKPELKLFLIISWLRGDVQGRQQYLVLLLGHLDWEVVANDFLLEISQTENFFTSNPSSLYLLLQTLHSAAITLGPYTDQFEALREQYSYLLTSVITSTVDLGTGRQKVFQPLALSVIYNDVKDESVFKDENAEVQLEKSLDSSDTVTITKSNSTNHSDDELSEEPLGTSDLESSQENSNLQQRIDKSNPLQKSNKKERAKVNNQTSDVNKNTVPIQQSRQSSRKTKVKDKLDSKLKSTEKIGEEVQFLKKIFIFHLYSLTLFSNWCWIGSRLKVFFFF